MPTSSNLNDTEGAISQRLQGGTRPCLAGSIVLAYKRYNLQALQPSISICRTSAHRVQAPRPRLSRRTVTARIEAAAPLPLISSCGIAGADSDAADMHIAIEDAPALLAGVGIAAAGQGGHVGFGCSIFGLDIGSIAASPMRYFRRADGGIAGGRIAHQRASESVGQKSEKPWKIIERKLSHFSCNQLTEHNLGIPLGSASDFNSLREKRRLLFFASSTFLQLKNFVGTDFRLRKLIGSVTKRIAQFSTRRKSECGPPKAKVTRSNRVGCAISHQQPSRGYLASNAPTRALAGLLTRWPCATAKQ
jgi:hypothetical protein